MEDCLSEKTLLDLLEGNIAEKEAARLSRQVDTCPRCRSSRADLLVRFEKLAGELHDMGHLDKMLDQQLVEGAHTGAGMQRGSQHMADHTISKSDAPPASDFNVRIPGYRITREIARGGMGVVYEALQLELGRHVALKVLPSSTGPDGHDAILRFRREASAAGKLHHSHIVPVYDFGQIGNTYYYAMELVEGETLAALIRRFAAENITTAPPAALAGIIQGSSISPPANESVTGSGSWLRDPSTRSFSDSTSRGKHYFRQVAQWMADVAEALHYAHAHGIIHRDIKPANLILSRDGRLMILDFGLAKTATEHTQTTVGSLLGTLRYMSPEQAMAKRIPVDHRTDVYSLGTTMYELLTLQPAFPGKDEKEILSQIIQRDPVQPRKIVPSVPRELQTICLKTMEKDPAKRYASARDLADDLRRYIHHLPIVAKPVGPIGRGIKFLRRRPAVSISVIAAVVLLPVVLFATHKHRENKRIKYTELIGNATRLWHDTGVPNWNEAERLYSQAIDLCPGELRGYFNLADMKKQQSYSEKNLQRLDEADLMLAKAWEISPDRQDIPNLRAINLRIRGKLQESEEMSMQAIQINRSWYAAWTTLGITQAIAGKVSEAEKSLREGVRLDTECQTKPLTNLAALQIHLGMQDALATLDRVKAPSELVYWHMLRARARLEVPGLSDPAAARDSAIAARETPGDGTVHRKRLNRVLALAYLANKDWSSAISAVRAAHENGDDARYVNLIWSIAAYNLGDTGTARVKYEEAKKGVSNKPGSKPTIEEEQGYLWCDNPAQLSALLQTAGDLLN